MKQPRRWWTKAEVLRACDMAARGLSWAQIARALGRPERCVGRYLQRYAPGRRRRPGHRRADHEGRLRELVALGRCFAALQRETGLPRSTLCRWLRELGLEPACGRGGRVQTAAGRERMAAWQAQRHRSACEALGWPEVTVPFHARVLDYLAAHGPASHAAIAAHLGWRLHRRARGRPTNPDLMAGLLFLRRLRHVERSGRRNGGEGYVYSVSPWLLARRKEQA